MAFYPQLKGAALVAHQKMVAVLRQRAMKELSLPAASIVLRSIRPQDVGLSTAVWSFSITSTTLYNTIINDFTILDNRFVGINGVFYDPATALVGTTTELISQLRITRMGALKREWNIQEISSQDDKVEYVDDPIVVDQNTTLKVEAFNATTSTDPNHEIGFKGMVAEKRGLLIA